MGFLKSAALAAIDLSGGLRLARLVHRGALRVLMYHRFQDPASLDRHCAHLRDCYHPVSLSLAAQWLDGEAPLPPCSVAVTIDDGYRSVFDVAYPIFSAYGVPITVFLVTDFVDSTGWLWGDRIRFAFDNSPLSQVSLALPGGTVLEIPLRSLDDRRQAAHSLKETAKEMANSDRLELLRFLPRALHVDLPEAPPRDSAPMTWDQVRELAAAGVEFGAHTRSHPILSRIAEPCELRREIEGSKDRIEQETGKPVLHFCYPNGRSRDFNPATVEAVARAGFRTAVTAEPGVNYPGVDRLLLCRIPVDASDPERAFRRRVTGVRL